MPKLAKSQKLELDGPAGKLEALLEAPQGTDIVGCAVVCHPHPLHGGTLQNKVAHTLARSFTGQGFIALRFNFRGVNDSEGTFDDGRGELEDVYVAMDFLSIDYPDLPLWISGFSFGAAMAIHAAAERRPAGLVSIAPAISRITTTPTPQRTLSVVPSFVIHTRCTAARCKIKLPTPWRAVSPARDLLRCALIFVASTTVKGPSMMAGVNSKMSM